MRYATIRFSPLVYSHRAVLHSRRFATKRRAPPPAAEPFNDPNEDDDDLDTPGGSRVPKKKDLNKKKPTEEPETRDGPVTLEDLAQWDPLRRVTAYQKKFSKESQELSDEYSPKEEDHGDNVSAWQKLKNVTSAAVKATPMGKWIGPTIMEKSPTEAKKDPFDPATFEDGDDESAFQEYKADRIRDIINATRMAQMAELARQGQSAPPMRVMQLHKAANLAMDKKDWASARALLTSCLRSTHYHSMETSAMLAVKGACARNMGLPHWALADYSNAILCDPTNTDLFLAMGEVYQSLHLYPEARKKFDQAKQLGHPNADEILAENRKLEMEWPKKIDKVATALATKIPPEQWPKVRQSLMDSTRGTFPRQWVEPRVSVAEIPEFFAQLVTPEDPFEIRDTHTPMGRGVYATRDIPAGEEVMEDNPLLSASLSDSRCDFCQKLLHRNDHSQCESCGREQYCDSECAGEAYHRYHSYVCGFNFDNVRIQAAKEVSQNGKLRGIFTIMALKAVGLTMRRKAYPMSTFDIPFWFALSSKYTPELRTLERQHIGTLPAYYSAVVFPILKGLSSNFDFEWFDRIIAKLMANSICVPGQTPAGEVEDIYGLYPRASFINHSCEPNAIVGVDVNEGGHVISVRATKDIKKGQEVFLSYTKADATYDQRTPFLIDHYGFACSCPRCQRERPEESKAQEKDLKDLWDDLLRKGQL